MWRPRSTSLAVATLLFVSLSARAAEPFRFPEKEHGKGKLQYLDGLPVLTVTGTPEEIGDQVGTLAVKPAERILDYPRELLDRFKIPLGWTVFVRAGGAMLPQFPEDHRKEFDAVIKSGIDRDKLVVGNTMFDLKKSIACSALHVTAERSTTKGPLFGRNLDYPSLGYAQEYGLITIYRPTGKRAFVSIGFPGLVGCLSGMNDAGLALGVLEIYAVKDGVEKFDAKGVPYALCYRRLLEECATVEEAEKLLRSMKRTTTMCLAICDKTTAAVFEITPTELVVRKAVDGICTCTNHFCTKELRPDNDQPPFRSSQRLEALEQARKQDKLGVADVHKRMHAACNPATTMQTMVFEPATLKLHVCVGTIPATAGELKTLDLATLFKK